MGTWRIGHMRAHMTLPRLMANSGSLKHFVNDLQHVPSSVFENASDSIEMLTAKQPRLFLKWNVPVARWGLSSSHLFAFDRLAIFSHHITAASTYFQLGRDANCVILQKRLAGLTELSYSLFNLLFQWLQTQCSSQLRLSNIVFFLFVFLPLWIKFKQLIFETFAIF